MKPQTWTLKRQNHSGGDNEWGAASPGCVRIPSTPILLCNLCHLDTFPVPSLLAGSALLFCFQSIIFFGGRISIMTGELRISFLVFTLSPLSTPAPCPMAGRSGLCWRGHPHTTDSWRVWQAGLKRWHTLVPGAVAEESGNLYFPHHVAVRWGPSYASHFSHGRYRPARRILCSLPPLCCQESSKDLFRKLYSVILSAQLFHTGCGFQCVCKTPPPTPAFLNP